MTYCRFSIRGEGYDDLWADMQRKISESSLEEVMSKEGSNEPLFKKIREDGAKRELPLIVETIRKFAEGVVCIKDKQLVVDGNKLESAFDISDSVDGSLGV